MDEVKDGMTAVRNPQLVHILDKLKYIENYGTGIRRMYEAYQDTNQSPDFEVRPNSFKVILPNVNYNNDTKNVIDSKVKDSTFILGLNEESVLYILSKNGRQTRKEIQQVLRTTPYHVRKLLSGLIKKGKVRKVGSSVNTQYEKR